jgi:1,4-alpha-glucan branching enzyme
MYEKGKRKGTVTFGIKAPAGSQTVMLAGDFNDWKPTAMKRRADGVFVADARVSQKTCQYKYVVDGRWITDPDHAHFAPNPFGSVNSVATTA